jgi:trans-2,3-dihydro-3-hydroxyanthranilate isomerase
MELEFLTADVFTTRRFGGNPLALVLDADGLTGEQMQAITREFNLSETAFVLRPEDAGHTARLRIFTPGRELPFAGHPTVGSALLLHHLGRCGDLCILEEGVGPVEVRIQGGPPVAELTVPRPPEEGPPPPPPAEVAALVGLDPRDIRDDGYAPAAVSAGVPFLVVPLRSREALAGARPDAAAFDRILGRGWAREVYLVVLEEEVVWARMFAPSLGIAEDPATGAAAAALAAYLGVRHGGPAGTLRRVIHQGVEMGRPSEIRIAVDVAEAAAGGNGPRAVSRIRVAGSAVPVMRGAIRV